MVKNDKFNELQEVSPSNAPWQADLESLKRVLFAKINKVIHDLTVCPGETYLFTRYPLIEL